MGDNGLNKDQKDAIRNAVMNDEPRTMTVNIYPNGTVEVLGLPNMAMVTKFGVIERILRTERSSSER